MAWKRRRCRRPLCRRLWQDSGRQHSVRLRRGEDVAAAGLAVLIVGAQIHEIDSRPLSFRLAARLGLRDCLANAELRPRVGILAEEAPELETGAWLARCAAYRMQFASLVAGMEGAAAQRLERAGFYVAETGLYVRDQGAVRHVVQFRPRWEGQLTIRLGVIVPTAAELLTGETLPARQADRFEAGITWSTLAALLPDGPDWSLDVYADPAQSGARVAAALAAVGLPFLARWDSAEMILGAAAAGEFVLGTRRTAALLHLTGRSDEALALLDAALADPQALPYFERALRALREEISAD